jgi:uncharacterized protein (TIGR04255 family)
VTSATEALHFEKAPIREAIIAIQVHDLPESTALELRLLPEEVKDSYPHKQDLKHAQFVGQLGPQGPTVTASERITGFQFQATDSKQIFQARVNGFSFHRLAPYQSWGPFRDEAFRLWKLYREVVGPVKILNFSVRYINALVVPAPALLEDYLRVYPQIPPDIPQTLRNYLMRLDLPLENEGSGEGTLTMVQSLVPLVPSELGTSSILLDNLFAYGASDVSDDILWNRIDAVQAVKNRVFVAALTPEMQKRIS